MTALLYHFFKHNWVNCRNYYLIIVKQQYDYGVIVIHLSLQYSIFPATFITSILYLPRNIYHFSTLSSPLHLSLQYSIFPATFITSVLYLPRYSYHFSTLSSPLHLSLRYSIFPATVMILQWISPLHLTVYHFSTLSSPLHLWYCNGLHLSTWQFITSVLYLPRYIYDIAMDFTSPPDSLPLQYSIFPATFMILQWTSPLHLTVYHFSTLSSPLHLWYCNGFHLSTWQFITSVLYLPRYIYDIAMDFTSPPDSLSLQYSIFPATFMILQWISPLHLTVYHFSTLSSPLHLWYCNGFHLSTWQFITSVLYLPRYIYDIAMDSTSPPDSLSLQYSIFPATFMILQWISPLHLTVYHFSTLSSPLHLWYCNGFHLSTWQFITSVLYLPRYIYDIAMDFTSPPPSLSLQYSIFPATFMILQWIPPLHLTVYHFSTLSSPLHLWYCNGFHLSTSQFITSVLYLPRYIYDIAMDFTSPPDSLSLQYSIFPATFMILQWISPLHLTVYHRIQYKEWSPPIIPRKATHRLVPKLTIFLCFRRTNLI